MIERKKTRQINVGGLLIGGGAPVVVQSMNNTDTSDIEATLEQIEKLAAAGCELTRLAIPDHKAARAFARICPLSPLPLVADIHFDYRLALEAIAGGAAKVRINPGNIGSEDRVGQVARAALANNIPLRIGVNSGSLSQHQVDAHGGVNAPAMVASVLEYVSLLENFGLQDLVLSIKASDPALTIEAYRLLAQKTDYPLHIGVTEAGTRREGVIRSAVGIGTLLAEGIGDTLRVSLTADPVEEVKAGWSILKALGLRRRGPELISCPGCGRTAVDLQPIAEAVEKALEKINLPLKVAVMGCAVNGPGEAKHADIGLAGGRGEFLIFRHGEILRKVKQEEAVAVLMQEISRLKPENMT